MFAKKNSAWNAALSIPGRRIAWVARRMAYEYCGFLEWLRQLGDAPCEIVDLHDLSFDWHKSDGTVDRAQVPSVGLIHPEHIRDNAFWDLARPLSARERQSYLALWDKLRAENAPLRVMNGDTLVSAPISYYDDLVLADTEENFRKVARIVGSALGWGRHTPKANLYVFHARVNKLVQAGVLEAKGNTAQMRYSEVRRVRGLQDEGRRAPIAGAPHSACRLGPRLRHRPPDEEHRRHPGKGERREGEGLARAVGDPAGDPGAGGGADPHGEADEA